MEYSQKHRESLSNMQTLDHDFHSAWGCVYSNQSTLSEASISGLWQQYADDPATVDRKYHMLLHDYTMLFSTFFDGYYPISMHAHASDALLPTTIASLILNTVATSPLVLNSPTLAPMAHEDPKATGGRIRDFALDFLGWNAAHVQAPNFVVAEGIYGAGFGPLAHASKEWEVNAIASGPKPIVVDVRNATRDSLNATLAEAKSQGCIAVVCDMVSTEDGSVLQPERFALLKACCAQNRLLIVIDETMTAIRCGAPFAFQRAEYAREDEEADKKPDLVIFGKGMGVSGIAMGFDGATIKRLAYTKAEEIQQTIRYWRALVSRPVRMPVLIEALGILRTAQAENWPARSIEIGDAVRDITQELAPDTREPGAIRGLGAMIAVNREVAMQFRIMSAIRRRSPWVRWLPKLSRSSIDRDLLLQQVFGGQSKLQRQKLAEEAGRCGTMPLWCFICGIEATSEDWCKTCYLSVCNNEVCEQAFKRHACI
ncbi:pyridoxal phosphate-dependent transferase [Biscogniauxia mediterranea]|nr:pyridoxal phosphate-dependent transferase [Biscogniauxia mediterranea]